jgi:hypothetical protein
MTIENTFGAKRLPTVSFNGKDYFVDFRLQELRDVNTALPIRFIDWQGKSEFNQLKSRLRGMRMRHEYMPGLDD